MRDLMMSFNAIPEILYEFQELYFVFLIKKERKYKFLTM